MFIFVAVVDRFGFELKILFYCNQKITHTFTLIIKNNNKYNKLKLMVEILWYGFTSKKINVKFYFKIGMILKYENIKFAYLP